MRRALFIIYFVGAGCISEPPPYPSTTNNTSTNNTSTNNTSTNNHEPCASCSGTEVCYENVCCEPKTVSSCGTQCGPIGDGCGGTIDCGVCRCSMPQDCPTRACQTATSCDNEECVYQPFMCGGLACECPDGVCDPNGLTDCRAPGALTCPAQFCDPSPSIDVSGKTVFTNMCAEPVGAVCDFTGLCRQGACNGSTCEQALCGLCNLGKWDCDEQNDATCYDIPAPAVGAAIDCSDGAAATFLYVDHTTGLIGNPGTRDEPLKSLLTEFSAAKMAARSADMAV